MVSVIVAASNEAETIEAALESILRLKYPALEIIAVDDRSLDATGDILDRIAGQDPRLHVLHITELPDGWLGKVHAMEQGRRRSSGEWLLFTDADVHFAPGCIQRAISLAENRNLDHLAALPQLLPRTFWLHVVQGLFGLFFLLGTRAQRGENTDLDSYIGVGGFNLVRRRTLERSPGLEWLKLEIADDVGLGFMLKRSGARGLLAFGLGCLAVQWYPTLGAMSRGLEKNAFAVFGYSWIRVLKICGSMCVVFLSPFVLFFPAPQIWQLAIIGFYLVSMIWIGELLRRHVGLWWLSSLFLYLAWPILIWTLLRSAWKTTRASGVEWRGTFYSLDRLKEGRRLDI